MAGKEERKRKRLRGGGSIFRRIGHKGADAIAPGNTIASFEAAVEQGVDMVELDILRAREGRLIVAHDRQDALARRPLDLADALDAFLEPPLDTVEIDCDLKLAGREAELAGALSGRGLLERAMVSTMEVESLLKLRRLEPELRLGWTYPKTRRDWTNMGWARAPVAAALAGLRRRFPRTLAANGPELGIHAVWAYHQLVTPKLADVADNLGLELIAWTVDDGLRMRELLEMGVHGICTNDPRLFAEVERQEKIAESADEETLEEGETEEGEKPKRKGIRRSRKRSAKSGPSGDTEEHEATSPAGGG
jgi:glycerophosphoryl diester phosphodiesterase